MLAVLFVTLIDLIILSKLENSKSEIRRLIKGNGIKINYHSTTKIDYYWKEKNSSIKLSLGKKRHIKVEIELILFNFF